MKQRKAERADVLPPDRKKIIYLILLAFFLIYIIGKFTIDISRSLFVQQPDRVNIVVYGEYPMFYSFGVKEAGNYAIPFYPDLKTQIPGGYGYYRIGAIGKMVKLEKKPELLQKTFSAITSSFVSYYFYEENEEVYYGGHNEDISAKPQIQQILFSKSNASFWDKLFLISYINRIQPSSLASINFLPYKRLKDDTVLRNDNFLKKYIGLFYNKAYRNENLNIQILYSKREDYPTAEMISSMLNGSGIVVGDLNRDESSSKKCIVIETEEISSNTAKDIAAFFKCDLKKGATDVYDILFVLGELEDSWEVN